MKPHTNGIEVHSELSHNRHPVDGAMVGGGFTMALNLGLLKQNCEIVELAIIYKNGSQIWPQVTALLSKNLGIPLCSGDKLSLNMRLDNFLLENMRVFLPGNMRLCFVWCVYVGLGAEQVKLGFCFFLG